MEVGVLQGGGPDGQTLGIRTRRAIEHRTQIPFLTLFLPDKEEKGLGITTWAWGGGVQWRGLMYMGWQGTHQKGTDESLPAIYLLVVCVVTYPML